MPEYCDPKLKVALLVGGGEIRVPIYYMVSLPHEFSPQTAYRSVHPFLHGSRLRSTDRQTHRPTDHATCVTSKSTASPDARTDGQPENIMPPAPLVKRRHNNRPRLLLCTAMRPNNKSVLSLVPRLSTRRYPHLLLSACAARHSCRSIFAAGARAQQQTSRTPLLLSFDGTGQTDGRTDGHPIVQHSARPIMITGIVY